MKKITRKNLQAELLRTLSVYYSQALSENIKRGIEARRQKRAKELSTPLVKNCKV
jgi:biotin-(acetyl-CoA carboxylase) ligase